MHAVEHDPLASGGLADVAISIGISQSGRMLRDLLYLGFNEDVRGRDLVPTLRDG